MKKNLLITTLKWGVLLGAGLSIVQWIRYFTADFEFYSFGPIMDLLLAVIFIGVLYGGIKEYRDKYKQSKIKFSTAYLVGTLITIIGFLIVFVYLNLQYSTIDKGYLDKLNRKNEEKFVKHLEKDTITTAELNHFLDKVKLNLVIDDAEICKEEVQNRLDTLDHFFRIRLASTGLADTAKYALKNFDLFARGELLSLYETLLATSPELSERCQALFDDVFAKTLQEIQKESVLKSRIEVTKDSLLKYDNVFAAALFFSLSVLIYGLLFNIFVSMYLYKSKNEKNTDAGNPVDADDNDYVENPE